MGVFQQFTDHPVLYNLSVKQVTVFIRLAACLKRDIQLPLPPAQSTSSSVPDILPTSIEQFLSKAIKIPVRCVGHMWDVFKDDVWAASPQLFFDEDLALFKEYGWTHGLSKSISHRRWGMALPTDVFQRC